MNDTNKVATKESLLGQKSHDLSYLNEDLEALTSTLQALNNKFDEQLNSLGIPHSPQADEEITLAEGNAKQGITTSLETLQVRINEYRQNIKSVSNQVSTLDRLLVRFEQL